MQIHDTSFNRLLIKVAALISFCGGPILLVDVLKPRFGVNVALGVCFLPITLMVFAALSMNEEEVGQVERVSVRLGFFGALIAIPLHLWGAFTLVSTPQRPDHTLYVVGVVIGLLASVGFAYAAKQWLSRTRAFENGPPFPEHRS